MTKKKPEVNQYNTVISFEDRHKKHGSLIDDIVSMWRKYKDEWRRL